MKKELYAQILLETCLKIDKNQPLLIRAEMEGYDFVRTVYDKAVKLGVKDIYLNMYDEHMMKSLYESLTVEELKKHSMFSRDIFNEYAKKDAAFLMLSSENPGLMESIEEEKIAAMRKHLSSTCEYFNERRDKRELSWCIASLPNKAWADKVFSNQDNSLELLWDKIFEINYLNEVDPLKHINENIKEKKELCDVLNNFSIKSLHFSNSLGTDVEIGLLDNGVWATGDTCLKNGKNVLVNYPSLEIFTSPHKYNINGVIKASMPLLVAGVVVEELEINLEKGKIVDVKSKTNEEILNKLINNESGANYLGEIALVENNSPISNTNILYYTTLLDENASCHFAFGAAFPECCLGSDNLSDDEKDKLGLNVSNTHVDVMFGTKDLYITGKTQDEKDIVIFENGNFSKFIKNEKV